MPTNVFFSPKVNTERFMYEDIIIESIKMYGQDVYYLPRKIVQRDYILGEDVEAQFNTANMVEMFIENTEGFEGEGNIFAKFGMEIRDEATFIVARRSWQRVVGVFNSDVNGERPQEGDLIYLPLSKSFFEISFVEHEQPFYQLSNLPVFKLQARLFEFSEEEFNTGIAEIDGVENEFGYQEVFEYGSVSGTFELGERIKYIITAARESSASATATLGNVGTVTSVAVDESGFDYALAPDIEFADHDPEDKALTNFTVTRDQQKFGSWSAYADDDTQYVEIEHTGALTQGTFEFFFKTKSDGIHNGELARFGDFKFDLQNKQITSRYKTSSQSVEYTDNDWNHVFVSATEYNGGTQTQYQIFINGTRVLQSTITGADVVLIGDGHYSDENLAKLSGINSTLDTEETNGVYFDAACIDSTGVLNTTSVTVPTSLPSHDISNEDFTPISAVGNAVINSNGEVTSITIVDGGRFYESAPAITIEQSTAADIDEVNVSAKIITYDNDTMYIHQVETSDGEYHEFGVGNSIVGQTSGASATITKVYDVANSETDNTFIEDPAARNFNFEEEADDIIDFSESNPFGDPTEG